MKIIGIVLLIAVALALPLLGCRPRSPEHMIDRVFKDISKTLNLSEAQTARLLSARDEIKEKGREMHEERKKMHQDLSRLILSESIDVNEVKAVAKEKHDKMGDFMDLHIDRFAEFHADLTPEQKKLLAGLFDKHTRRMKRMHP